MEEEEEEEEEEWKWRKTENEKEKKKYPIYPKLLISATEFINTLFLHVHVLRFWPRLWHASNTDHNMHTACTTKHSPEQNTYFI